jgi:hypothetical protein
VAQNTECSKENPVRMGNKKRKNTSINNTNKEIDSIFPFLFARRAWRNGNT